VRDSGTSHFASVSGQFRDALASCSHPDASSIVADLIRRTIELDVRERQVRVEERPRAVPLDLRSAP
jgi:hypothetical protein